MADVMGLLDLTPEDKQGAINMGLLQAGLGVLAHNTDRGNPMRAIGLGGMQGLQGYQQAYDRAQKEKLLNIEKAKLIRDAEMYKRQQAALDKYPQLRKLADLGVPMGELFKPQNVTEGGTLVAPGFGMMGNVQSAPEQAAPQPAQQQGYGVNPAAYKAFGMDAPTAPAMPSVQQQPIAPSLPPGVLAQGQPKRHYSTINGKVYVTQGDRTTDAGGPGEKVDYNKPFLPNGSPNQPYIDYSLRHATSGAARQIQNVNAFTPASEAAQKDLMDKVAKDWDALKRAPVALQNLAGIKDLASKGNPFIGSLGEQKMAIAQFFNNNFGTSVAPEDIADANGLRTRLFERVKDELKKMDAQPSQMQQKIMQDAFGNLNTDPNALKTIVDITEGNIRGNVAIHNKTVEDATTRGVKVPVNPIISLPEKATPTVSPNVVPDLPPPGQNKGKRVRDTTTGKILKSNGMAWVQE